MQQFRFRSAEKPSFLATPTLDLFVISYAPGSQTLDLFVILYAPGSSKSGFVNDNATPGPNFVYGINIPYSVLLLLYILQSFYFVYCLMVLDENFTRLRFVTKYI